MSVQLKNKLDQNIWVTRKCRINASERLLKNAQFIEFINVYYSIFLILLSLISMSSFDYKNETLSFVSFAGSIVLTISIIYANSLGYRERSVALKQNYIDLQLLLDRLAITDENNSDELLSICDDYAKLLESVENHLVVDMLNLMRTSSVNNHAMTLADHFYWFIYYCRQFVWRFVLVAAPICYLFYIFL